jgi:hypothetical protein
MADKRGTWTMHQIIRTAEAIQYVPALPLGEAVEWWGHVRGDHPTDWRQWKPRCELPRGTGVDQIDGVASYQPSSCDDHFPDAGNMVDPPNAKDHRRA